MSHTGKTMFLCKKKKIAIFWFRQDWKDGHYISYTEAAASNNFNSSLFLVFAHKN